MKYDRNSNLDSHKRIFWRFGGSNPHPHRGGVFKEGITTGPNTQVATFLIGVQVWEMRLNAPESENEQIN